MSKSAFVESALKDSLVSSSQLFGTTDSLSSAVVLLSKQLNYVHEVMKDKRFLENLEKINNEKGERAGESIKNGVSKYS